MIQEHQKIDNKREMLIVVEGQIQYINTAGYICTENNKRDLNHAQNLLRSPYHAVPLQLRSYFLITHPVFVHM